MEKLQVTKKEIAVLIAVSLMSLLANLPEGMGGSFINRKMLLGALFAVVVIAMFRYLQVLLLLTISILAIGANLPKELAHDLGISQTTLIVSLAILVAITLLNRMLGVLPVHSEPLEEPDDDEALDFDGALAREHVLATIARGDITMLRRLLAANTDINFVQNGTTPLHFATEKGYSAIVQLLIDNGANLLALNGAGKTPLDVALEIKKFAKTSHILYEATIPLLVKHSDQYSGAQQAM